MLMVLTLKTAQWQGYKKRKMWVAKTRNPRFSGVLILPAGWNLYLLTWALFLRSADPAILTDLLCPVMAAI